MTKPRLQIWTCPGCGKSHDKEHWPDHHQEVPGWKDSLDGHSWEKGSNPDYQIVCEICGTHLTRTDKDGDMPYFCRTCKEPRQGVPAPQFCPHCGWTQERIVLVKV